MDITAEEVRSLENMDAEDGGVGEGGDVVRVVDGGAGDAIVMGGDDRGRGDRGRGDRRRGDRGRGDRGRGDRGRGRGDRERGDRGRGLGDRGQGDRGRGRGGEVNFYAEYIHVYYY